jgi:multiple sugar transport system substrate-binding protein
MKKLTTLILTLIIVSSSLLAGCGNSSSGQTAESPAQTAGEESSAVSEEKEQRTPADGQVLTLWDVVVREPHPVARDKVIAMFEEKNPGIKVEVTTLTGDINQKIQSAAAGGTLPDLIFTWNPGDVTTWGQMGITAPVDDIVEEYGPDWWLSAKQMELYQIDGKTWGVPLVTFPTTLWYDKDRFDAQGLDVPTTWDEWYDAALKLTKDTDGDGEPDQFGLVLGIAEGWPFGDIRGSNADYWWDAQGNLTFSDKTIETLDFLRKMYDDTCYPGSVSFQNEGQRLGFLSGQGATMVTSISFVNTIIEEKGLDWLREGHVGVAPIPSNAAPDEGAGSGASTHAIGVMDGSNVDLAKDFLRFWLSEEALVTYFSSNIPGHLPPYTAVWDSEEFRAAHEAYWDLYETGREIIATTQWFHPTAKWEALFNADGGDGKNVMSYVTVERMSSEEIVEKLKKIAENAKAEIE